MSVVVRSLLIFILVSPVAFAKDSRLESQLDGDCPDLLKNYTTNLNFALSDAEGLFFEFIRKAIQAPNVPPQRTDLYALEFLSMKAELLNDLAAIIPNVEEPTKLASIYQMIDTMGLDPQMFGLGLDENSRVASMWKKMAQQMKGNLQAAQAKFSQIAAETPAKPIGFLPPQDSVKRDLPQTMHRSIGFGPHTVSESPGPQRKTGYISRELEPGSQFAMRIYDYENEVYYLVDQRIVIINAVQSPDKTYVLNYNQAAHTWYVDVTNIHNPENRMGFIHH